jgi:DNA repair exonuclease SbcCD nuclease subunit
MTEILCVGDLHLADRPPSSCTESYLDDLFGLLDQTVTIAGERDVAAVVWAGDVFHCKAPSRTSHKLVLRTAALIQRYPCRLLIVPGNHDLSHDRLESVRESQPLGVLFEAGAELLSGWDYELPIYGVPWLGEFSAENIENALALWRARPVLLLDNSLVVTHAPLYPPGFENPFECVRAAHWAAFMGSQGSCMYGHVHDAHGVFEVGGVAFCNNGALTRGSLTEENINRELAVTIWHADPWFRFETVPLEYRPSSEVFRMVEIGEQRDQSARVKEFLDSITGVSLEQVTQESVMAAVDGATEDREIRELIRELLDEVS